MDPRSRPITAVALSLVLIAATLFSELSGSVAIAAV